jgi:hypothetical protein
VTNYGSISRAKRLQRYHTSEAQLTKIKVVGTLANKSPEENEILNGVLVQKDFNMSLIAAEDLREFAGLDTNVVMQRLTVAFHGGLPLVKWHLDQMFGGVILESGDNGKKPMFKASFRTFRY